MLDQVQALAEVPAAAMAFVLRRTAAELSEALGLDLASPLFWPLVARMSLAVRCQARGGVALI